MPRSTSRALTLVTTLIAPPAPAAFIAPAMARIDSQAPLRLIARTRSHSSGGTSNRSPECPTPAHTAARVGTPTVSTVRWMAPSTLAGTETSHTTSALGFTSHTTGLAPRCFNRSATAAPIPDAPPVTTATRSRSSMTGNLNLTPARQHGVEHAAAGEAVLERGRHLVAGGHGVGDHVRPHAQRAGVGVAGAALELELVPRAVAAPQHDALVVGDVDGPVG